MKIRDLINEEDFDEADVDGQISKVQKTLEQEVKWLENEYKKKKDENFVVTIKQYRKAIEYLEKASSAISSRPNDW